MQFDERKKVYLLIGDKTQESWNIPDIFWLEYNILIVSRYLALMKQNPLTVLNKRQKIKKFFVQAYKIVQIIQKLIDRYEKVWYNKSTTEYKPHFIRILDRLVSRTEARRKSVFR